MALSWPLNLDLPENLHVVSVVFQLRFGDFWFVAFITFLFLAKSPHFKLIMQK